MLKLLKLVEGDAVILKLIGHFAVLDVTFVDSGDMNWFRDCAMIDELDCDSGFVRC